MVPPELLKYYQTFNEKQISEYPSHQQTEIHSSAFRTDRKDMYLEKKNPLKNILQKQKIKGSSFMSKFFLILIFNYFILKYFIDCNFLGVNK